MKIKKIMCLLVLMFAGFFMFNGEVYATDPGTLKDGWCFYQNNNDANDFISIFYIDEENGTAKYKVYQGLYSTDNVVDISEKYKAGTSGFNIAERKNGNLACIKTLYAYDVTLDGVTDTYLVTVKPGGMAHIQYNAYAYNGSYGSNFEELPEEQICAYDCKNSNDNSASSSKIKFVFTNKMGEYKTFVDDQNKDFVLDYYLSEEELETMLFQASVDKCPKFAVYNNNKVYVGNDSAIIEEVKDGNGIYCGVDEESSNVIDRVAQIDNRNEGNSIPNVGAPTGPPMTCQSLKATDTYKIIREIFKWIQIAAPIMLIIFGVIDFGKAVAVGDNDAMKKAQSTFVKRIIVVAIIILLPFIMNLLISLLDGALGNDVCSITT